LAPLLDGSGEFVVGGLQHPELVSSKPAEAAEHLDEHRPGEPGVVLACQFAQPFETQPIGARRDIQTVAPLAGTRGSDLGQSERRPEKRADRRRRRG
jgi:hypothetical protein